MGDKNATEINSNTLLKQASKPKKILVDFKSQKHTFRITKDLKFSQLLETASRHFGVDEEDHELRDVDGSIWPGSALVLEGLEEDVEVASVFVEEGPVVYMSARNQFRGGRNSPSDGFSNSVISSPKTTQLFKVLAPAPSPYLSARRPGAVSRTPSPPATTRRPEEKDFSIKEMRPPDSHVIVSPPSQTAHIPADSPLQYIPTESGLAQPNDSADNSDNGGHPLKRSIPPPIESDAVRETLAPERAARGELYIPVEPSSEAASDKTQPTSPEAHIQHSQNTGSNIETSSNYHAFSNIESPSLVVPTNTNGKSKRGIRLFRENDEICITEVVENSEIETCPTTSKQIRLIWEHPPQNVLAIKKKDEPHITQILLDVAKWLKEEKNINVLVEPHVKEELPHLEAFNEDELPQLAKKVDFVICLGGDGTVLHANSLFHESTPPVVAFNLGSLGFLTPFRIRNYKRTLNSVMSECFLTLRSRLLCIVVQDVDGQEVITKHTVLNEVVLDRGSSPYLSQLECYCDDLHITTIHADGIIIATTTGSTAYSLSAGGSMVHPQVPAILFTPICPHSLSFRPLLFPDAAEIKLQVPKDSRASAWASFDGRSRIELKKGDYIIIRVSRWPFVWINKSDTVQDWFASLAECLHWNDRQKQK